MFSIKEQAEVFKIGLMIGYFKEADIIFWAEHHISSSKYPDLGVIDVLFFGNKGINEIIIRLDNVKGKIKLSIPIKTILGLLYKDFINKKITVLEIARKLYALSQHIPADCLEHDKLFKLNAMEDIFHIYGTDSVSVQIVELLKEYEIFAEDFCKLPKI